MNLQTKLDDVAGYSFVSYINPKLDLSRPSDSKKDSVGRSKFWLGPLCQPADVIRERLVQKFLCPRRRSNLDTPPLWLCRQWSKKRLIRGGQTWTLVHCDHAYMIPRHNFCKKSGEEILDRPPFVFMHTWYPTFIPVYARRPKKRRRPFCLEGERRDFIWATWPGYALRSCRKRPILSDANTTWNNCVSSQKKSSKNFLGFPGYLLNYFGLWSKKKVMVLRVIFEERSLVKSPI